MGRKRGQVHLIARLRRRGNQTLLVDPLGHETRWTFDENGRQLSRTLPLGFGSDGKLTASETPTDDFTESFEYDELGRQKLYISFEGVVTENVYGTDGRLTQQRFFDNLTQFDGGNGTPPRTWTFTYDAFGRQVNVAKFDSASVQTANESVGYNSQGQVVSTTTAEGTVSYTRGRKGVRTH